jgi:hypothetical protein
VGFDDFFSSLEYIITYLPIFGTTIVILNPNENIRILLRVCVNSLFDDQDFSYLLVKKTERKLETESRSNV